MNQIQTYIILGIPISLVTKSDVLSLIQKACVGKKQERPLFLVTAYSETFLEAEHNLEFRAALQKADYIVPDGVSVLQAVDYVRHAGKQLGFDLIKGLVIGMKTLQGKYKNRVTGVDLVRTLLTRLPHEQSSLAMTDKKIMLLGGWNGVAEKLAKKYDCFFDNGPANLDDLTQEENKKLLFHIGQVKPDILLVSFGRFRQEMWIADNLEKIAAKVVIGVGSSFDEIAGEGIWAKKVPGWVETMGLKWLWRAQHDHSHLIRAWHAFPVFPWKVFRSAQK